MNSVRLFSVQVFMAILFCSTLLLAGCGDNSSHRSDSTQQMGGAIQGKELALMGATATIFGKGDLAPNGYRTSVAMVYPYGITVVNDNLYVTEMFNHTIRKIDMASGEVTTLAGVAGSPGLENSSEGVARFEEPLGITSDGANLYVCDGRNHTIRRVVIASGEVTTLAGSAGNSGSTDGIGSEARFSNPNSIATDGTYLYVTDLLNHTIRQVVIATGEVTTLAGSVSGESGSTDGSGSAARFFRPNGIAIDGGNLYVVDTLNHTIRRIVIATGEVTTLAGSAGEGGSTDGSGSDARFNEPRGISIDGDILYVTDGSNNTIRKVVIATGQVTTVAGIAMESGAGNGIGVEARFYGPRGVVALDNRLYVSDTNNNLIRAVDLSAPENTVSTFAGFISHQFSDMTTDGTNLFLSDLGSKTIQKFDIATGVITTLAGSFGTMGSTDGDNSVAMFNFPMGITTDGTNLYVTEFSDNTIRRVNIASGEVSTLAGSAGTYGSADGIGTAAKFNSPAGITTDGTYLYVADYYNNIIRQIEIATGAVTTLAGSAGSKGSVDGIGSNARFYYPGSITTDGKNLFMTDSANNNIRRIVIATGEVTTVAGNAESRGSTDGSAAVALFDSPNAITTDGKTLYIVDASTKIRSIR